MGCCRILWVLDASINISMEPFRALVADKLNDEQRSYGFVVQTLIIGIGTWIASNLPWLVTKLGISNEAGPGVVPPSVKIAFAIGAFVFIASILYTIFTTSEYPLMSPTRKQTKFICKRHIHKYFRHALHHEETGNNSIF